VAIWWFFL
uniref:Uncharacterized protein n=1 Tax=Solanum lycopersicum TaxID=4081 RepID=A0A3Q7J8U7_SOLLC